MQIKIIALDGSDPLDQKKFRFLFEGFLGGGAIADKKNLPILRTEAKILTKLESISSEEDSYIDSLTHMRKLLPFKQTLEFEVPEFDLLRRYLESVPWKASVSRDIVDCIDWLDGIQQVSTTGSTSTTR